MRLLDRFNDLPEMVWGMGIILATLSIVAVWGIVVYTVAEAVL